jgi:hypothetical protein
MNEKPLKTPDLTPAQIIAGIATVLTQLVAVKWIDGATAKTITSLAGIVIPGVWMFADAIIRHGRSKAAATVKVAKIHADAARYSGPHKLDADSR